MTPALYRKDKEATLPYRRLYRTPSTDTHTRASKMASLANHVSEPESESEVERSRRLRWTSFLFSLLNCFSVNTTWLEGTVYKLINDITKINSNVLPGIRTHNLPHPRGPAHKTDCATRGRPKVPEEWLVKLADFFIGATVAERSACLPSTKVIRLQSPAGPLRIFACGNRAGRFRWSTGFFFPSGISRFPPPLHSGAAPFSPQLNFIGSQDLAVKSRPNLFTHPKVIGKPSSRPWRARAHPVAASERAGPAATVAGSLTRGSRLQCTCRGRCPDDSCQAAEDVLVIDLYAQYRTASDRNSVTVRERGQRACDVTETAGRGQEHDSNTRSTLECGPRGFSKPRPSRPESHFARYRILAGSVSMRLNGLKELDSQPYRDPFPKPHAANKRMDTPTSKGPPRRFTPTSRLPPGRIGFDSRRGRSRTFARGNRAGRCRWSAGFLRDIQSPQPFSSGTAPYSPHFTLIGSLD
ncbi:hypothetical protein PR048_017617 [Dryococelus australis]|uniref:Uncharacterized protein n=1 Tax=Dryococelus australis TaxID=614101 RepID=A0ABQ9HA49_9NEOP|nr:hypothetical protein PR048_017617 [Dryococelus australis]